MAHKPLELSKFPLIPRELQGAPRIINEKDIYRIGEILVKTENGTPHLYLVKSNGQIISLENHILGKIFIEKVLNNQIVVEPDISKDLPEPENRRVNSYYLKTLSKGSYFIRREKILTAPPWAVTNGKTFYGSETDNLLD